MLFKKNGKTYTIKNSTLNLTDGKPISHDKVKKIKVVKNYKSFLKNLKVVLVKYKQSKFGLTYFLFNKCLFVGVDNKNLDGKKIKLQFKYEFEIPEIKKMIKDIFPFINKDGELSMWKMNNIKYNHLPLGIINVLMASRILKLNGEKTFKFFKKKQPNGKLRDIYEPHDDILEPLREVNKILSSVYDKRNIDLQVGYKQGKNIKKNNVTPHKENWYMVKMDIKGFFTSCKRDLVEKYVKFMFNYVGDNLKNEFIDIIISDKTNSLFLGDPVSGTIANVIISKPAKYIQNILAKTNKTITIYADDIAISANKKMSKSYLRSVFKKAFTAYNLDTNFKLNPRKTIGMSGHRRHITGLSINADNEITVTRKYYSKLRVKIHKLSLGEMENLSVLRGKISWGIKNDETGKIKRYLMKFPETVIKHKLVGKSTMKELGLI